MTVRRVRRGSSCRTPGSSRPTHRERRRTARGSRRRRSRRAAPRTSPSGRGARARCSSRRRRPARGAGTSRRSRRPRRRAGRPARAARRSRRRGVAAAPAHAAADHGGRVEARRVEHVRDQRGGRRLAVASRRRRSPPSCRIISASISARGITGTWRRSASATSGLLGADGGRDDDDVRVARRAWRRGRRDTSTPQRAQAVDASAPPCRSEPRHAAAEVVRASRRGRTCRRRRCPTKCTRRTRREQRVMGGPPAPARGARGTRP